MSRQLSPPVSAQVPRYLTPPSLYYPPVQPQPSRERHRSSPQSPRSTSSRQSQPSSGSLSTQRQVQQPQRERTNRSLFDETQLNSPSRQRTSDLSLLSSSPVLPTSFTSLSTALSRDQLIPIPRKKKMKTKELEKSIDLAVDTAKDLSSLKEKVDFLYHQWKVYGWPNNNQAAQNLA